MPTYSLVFLDNFDSFTYNIVDCFLQLNCQVEVVRDITTCRTKNPTHLVIGPGPHSPKEATHSHEALSHFLHKIPILGVCLGHQIIASYFGASVVRAPKAVHGKVYPITHSNTPLFHGLPNPFNAVRYHSLCVQESSLPPSLAATARANDDTVMALCHTTLPIFGIQFHPESAMGEHGLQIFNNFLNITS